MALLFLKTLLGLAGLLLPPPPPPKPWPRATNLGDEAFGGDELGSAIGMSRTRVHRKLKALTGQLPGEYIRGTRLHRARALLRAPVGFGSPAVWLPAQRGVSAAGSGER